MTLNDFTSTINTLNRLAIYTVTCILCAKIIEVILRSLNLTVLAFFPGMFIEVAHCIIDVFLVPYLGLYAISIMGYLISRHSN